VGDSTIMPRSRLAMLPRCPVRVGSGVFFLCNHLRSPCSRVAASLHRARDMMMEEARACGIPGFSAPECRVLPVLLLCSGSRNSGVRCCATKGWPSLPSLKSHKVRRFVRS